MKIDSKWSIDNSSEGSTLIFAEKRIKKVTDKTTKKPTGEEVEYLYTEPYYYNNVKSCLKAYLLKSLEPSTDVTDCIRRIETAEETINTFLRENNKHI